MSPDEIESARCPFGADCPTAPCWQEAGWTGHRCRVHATIFVSPRPTPAAMRALYDHDAAGGASAAAHVAFSWQKDLDARVALRLLQSLARGGDLLEVGPGGGQFLQLARDAGFRPHAIELNAAQARHLEATLGIPTHCGSIDDPHAFPGATFDAVYHKDLVSHLHDPERTLRTLCDRLRPGGVMLCETGNGGDLDDAWLRRLGRLSYPEHLHLFGAGSVVALLERAGFVDVRVRRRCIVPWLYAVKAKHRLGRRTTAPSDRDAAPSAPKPDLDVSASGRGAKAFAIGFVAHALKYRLPPMFPRRWPSTLLVTARRAPG